DIDIARVHAAMVSYEVSFIKEQTSQVRPLCSRILLLPLAPPELLRWRKSCGDDGVVGGGQFKQPGAVLGALFLIADDPEPFHNVGTVEPASRVDRQVARQRLNLPDMLLAEAYGVAVEEFLLCGEKRVRRAIRFVPRDDCHHLVVLQQGMGTTFPQVHHQVVVGGFGILAGGDIYDRNAPLKVMKNAFNITDSRCACLHFSYLPSFHSRRAQTTTAHNDLFRPPLST